MFKAKFINLSLITLLGVNANAISLDDMLNKGKDEVISGIKDKVFENLDEHYKKLFEEGLSLGQSCFDIDTDINLNNVDFCSIADKLDKLKVNACSIIGGSGKKNISVSGARRLCENKAKEFEDYASKGAIDVIENSILNTSEDNKDSFSAKLPNGKSISEFYESWEVRNILKDSSPTNVVGNYLKDGNFKALSVFMDFAKTAKGNKNINELKIEDLKAPASIEDYKKGVKDTIESQRKLVANTNANNISSLVKSKLNSGNSKEATKMVEDLKQEFDLAKNAEISLSLANANYNKIPIPTQEYVNSVRKDLQPEVIAQIRAQQAFESAKISEIEEKWNRKYELAKLIADKEVILSQEFDEESAKAEIDKIVASASGSSSSSIIDGAVDSAKDSVINSASGITNKLPIGK